MGGNRRNSRRIKGPGPSDGTHKNVPFLLPHAVIPDSVRLKESADYLRLLIKSSGMTGAAVARRLGITSSGLQNYLHEERGRPAPYLVQFALECIVYAVKGELPVWPPQLRRLPNGDIAPWPLAYGKELPPMPTADYRPSDLWSDLA